MAAENLIQILLTSIIQGITEFLPVSSSGHISFLNELFNWSDIKLTLMVSAHFGTLFAVMYYFRCDVKKFFISGFFSLLKKEKTINSKIFLNIVYSTIPILIFGIIITLGSIQIIYNKWTIITATIFFAIILFLADKSKINKKIENLTIFDALIIGFFQLFALIPGSSRAGLCISGARFLGLDRISAATYSMYLAIPSVSGAVFLSIIEITRNTSSFSWLEIFSVFCLSFLFALVTIDFFIKILRKINLTFFVIYRIIIAILFGIIIF